MEGFTLLLSAGLLLLSFLYLLKRLLPPSSSSTSNGKRLKAPPGPKGVPVLGYIPYMRPPVFKHFTDLAKQYGAVYEMHLGQMKFVVINSFAAFKEAFLNDADNFSGRIQSEYIHEISDASGLLFVEGEKWRIHRRFSLRVLRDLGFGKQSSEAIIKHEVEDLLQHLNRKVGTPMDTLDQLNRSVANVISSLVMGERPGYEEQEFSELLQDMNFLAHDTSFISMIPIVFPSMKFIIPFLERFSTSTRRAREVTLRCQNYIGIKVDSRKSRISLSTIPSDFMEAYLVEHLRLEKEGKPHTFTRMQLIRVIFEMFIAGMDTTAATLSWGLLLLSLHPDVQRQVSQEIHAVLGKDTKPILSHRKELPYCCATIDEIFRFSSIAPLGLPHRNLEDASVEGYHIEKHSIVMPNLYAVHHDPQRWATPDEFNPAHFLDKSGTLYQPREDLIPFNIGRRSCLGESLARAETFLFFTSIMQQFAVALHEAHKHNVATLLLGTEGTIRVPAKHQLVFTRH